MVYLLHSSLQSVRCQGLCGSSVGCFGFSVDNNDCGVECNVSYITMTVECSVM